MIITHPTWRAIHLMDEASIDYLNRMFKQGWGMVPFDMDGIPWLVMHVPIDTPKRINFNDEHQRLAAGKLPSMWIVVLRKDGPKDMFRAFTMRPDATGYVSIQGHGLDITEWRSIMMLNLDGGLRCEIFGR